MRIAGEVLARLVGHCQEEYPREACGALIGTGEEISGVVPVPNVAAVPECSYRIDPAKLSGLQELVGLYHSHPNAPAHFSRDDLALGVPGWLYVVVSLRAAGVEEIRAWRPLNRRVAAQETLVVL